MRTTHWMAPLVSGFAMTASFAIGADLPPPIARWPFEEISDGNMPDAVGTHVGKGSDTLRQAAGVEGQSLVFDGRESLVTVPSHAALSIGDDAFSVSAWVNAYELDCGQQMIVAKNDYAAGQREWGLMLDKDNLFRFYVSQGGWKTLDAKTVPTPGQWCHIAVTLENGVGRIYVNGLLEGKGTLATAVVPTTAPVTLGGVHSGKGLTQLFHGALDEVALYKVALSAETVKCLADKHPVPHRVELVKPVTLWSGGELPKSGEIQALSEVALYPIKRHEPDKDGYQWLHGVGLIWHGGKLYASFGNNKGQENSRGEQARGRISSDGGKTWGEPFTIASGDEHLGVSHGVYLSHKGVLWSFHGAFYDDFQRTHTRVFRLDEKANAWSPVELKMDEGFWPLQNPVRMEDGNWIMAGVRVAKGYTNAVGNLPAVALSRGEDFTRWDLVVLPCDTSVPVRSVWGESTVIVDGPRVTNIARWGRPTSLVSESADFGRTWTPIRASNLPMAASKPHAGLLSTGQRYLICTTTADSGNRRAPLTLAVSRPGETTFSQVFVIRPALLDGAPDSTERSSLSYPCAVEHDGKLYVGYSNSGGRGGNFNSGELAVIPLQALQVKTSAAATPAVPNFAPGPEYADSARLFQGIPGIERAANGRLWATWYGGGVTEDKDNYILLYTSGDDGKSWQRVLVLDPDGAGPVRPFDPCLWLDPSGRLWLFWAQEIAGNPGRISQSFAIMTSEPASAAATWSAPRAISRGVMMNKPIVTSDGRWLLPIATWFTNGSSRAVVSTDQGVSFPDLGAANIPDVKSRSADEHMIVERKYGTLWMLVRGKFPPGEKDYTGIGESISADGGKTWSAVKASSIPHPVSRFFIRKLASGRFLLVRHDPPNAGKLRSHLTAFISEDDGLTWKGGLMLDERFGVSYPDGVQAPDGSVYVIYDYQRGRDKEILMAVFTEADVQEGKLTSPTSRLRVRVNQATGVKPAAKPNLELNPNTNGVARMAGPAAGLAETAGETDVFDQGSKLFLNRDYTVGSVPEALRGFHFIRRNLGKLHAVCRKAGVVYVLTPSTGRDPFSLEAELFERGFKKVNLPEFPLFASVRCSVFQKQLAAGEALDAGAWGVLVLPE